PHASLPLSRSRLCPYTTLFRSRHDVLNEPMAAFPLGGLTEAELRARSHTPQKYYGQPHFMPDYTQCWTLLAVNRARTTARQAELDRKSTRLNSSHVSISYAVCC